MEDKFDKILSNKIKEVTENRDIPYNPEHWKMLMAKKKKKKIFFYWQIAAFFLVTLLAGGLGKYFLNTLNFPNSNNPKIILDNKNDSLRIDSLKTNNNIFITSSAIDSVSNSDSNVSLIDSTTINNKIKYNSNKLKVKEAVASAESSYKKQHLKNKNVILPIDDNIEVLNDSLNGDYATINKDSIIEYEKLVQVAENETNKDSVVNINAIANNKLKKDSLIIKKDIALLEKEDDALETKTNKPIKLGIDVSPLYNYNQQSESSNVGFAGGITIEIPISNKFDISSGVFYADQKLNLNKPTGYLSDVVSSKSSSQLITKEAVIKGIEMPINLKYNFSIDKKAVFVSAGFTSTSYIKDNIEENFLVNGRAGVSSQDSYGNNIVTYELVQIKSNVVTPNDSNSFNFANMLNFSLGIELPINKQQQSVVIEPYFKYSLTPVTQQKLDFSSAGIHLRYNFSFKKKN